MVEIRTFRSRGWAAAFCAWLIALPAFAQESVDPVEAARHFDRGYLLAQQGSLEAAIHEFEKAYELSPHPSVLYNLGQAYAASGRAVQAVRTLERYLASAESKLDEERRAQARAVIDYQSQRIGVVAIEVEPPGSELALDGVSLGKSPLSGPIPVSAGVHALYVSADGYVPLYRRLDVAAKSTLRQQVRLKPLTSRDVTVHCAVPDVEVWAGERRLTRLPRGGRLTAPGTVRALRFERAGFVASRVTLPEDQSLPIDCGLSRVDEEAELMPVTVEAGKGQVVLVNGRPFQQGSLPPGRHALLITGEGLQATEQVIDISRGRPHRMSLAAPPAATLLLRERDDRRRGQRLAALISAGVGVLGLATAAAVYVVNERAYERWRRDGTRLAERARTMPEAVQVADWDALLQRENALRNWDSAALGAAVLGGALVTVGAGLWLTAPSVDVSGVTVRIGRAPWVGYAGSF